MMNDKAGVPVNGRLTWGFVSCAIRDSNPEPAD